MNSDPNSVFSKGWFWMMAVGAVLIVISLFLPADSKNRGGFIVLGAIPLFVGLSAATVDKGAQSVVDRIRARV